MHIALPGSLLLLLVLPFPRLLLTVFPLTGMDQSISILQDHRVFPPLGVVQCEKGEHQRGPCFTPLFCQLVPEGLQAEIPD